MTVKECVKIKGLQTCFEGSLKRYQSVDIDFINADGMEDETQFDVCRVLTRRGLDELSSLFSDFCKENGFKANTVQSVTIVRCANSMEELEAMAG